MLQEEIKKKYKENKMNKLDNIHKKNYIKNIG